MQSDAGIPSIPTYQTPYERELAVRKRLRDDLEHYSRKCLTIRTKGGSIDKLTLNKAQLYLHNALEAQLATKGRVRALIVKGRQEGTSTYVQARFFHKTTHRTGCRSFILTHDADATSNIYDMVQRFYDNLPTQIKPQCQVSNAKELVFNVLSSGYRVGTAGNKAVGRSQTIQFFHGSEVAYWASDEEHWAGILQAVPNAAGTEVILESTSAGPKGKFYDVCKSAHDGEGDFQLIFLPWYWMDEYREKPPLDYVPSKDEEDIATKYQLDRSQLWWRRMKIIELGGVSRFRREYPFTIEEAFKADAVGALWNRDTIAKYRVTEDQVPLMRRIVVGVDPAAKAKPKSDETGIITVGLGQNDHVYVFDDRSGKYSPAAWASAAIATYDQGFNGRTADAICAEENQGGDMVQAVIRQQRQSIGYIGKHVHDGKRVRAEPVAHLYEIGMVHHVGVFGALEDEQCTWSAAQDDESPNRIDALTLAVTELVINPESNLGMLEYYKKQADKLKASNDTPDQQQRRDYAAVLR